MTPNMECKLELYSPCEDAITFGLSTTREEKIKMMTKSQQAIIKAWEKLKGE